MVTSHLLDNKVLLEARDRVAALEVVAAAVDMVARHKETPMDNKAPMAVRDRAAVPVAAVDLVDKDKEAVATDNKAPIAARDKEVVAVMDDGVKVWAPGS